MYLAVCIMVKNEKGQIERTIASCQASVDGFMFLDTGSSDGTPKIIQEICNRNGLEYFLYHSQFVDFSTTRNYLLECAQVISRAAIIKSGSPRVIQYEY